MTTKTEIVVDDDIRVTVVPQYFLLKRKHGQLLKDFGLLKHQRKAVYDLVHTFMHANSHQNSLREVAPPVLGTHKSGLRKSQSLGSLNTIEQKPLASPLPLANTDSESGDDTPPHTTTHTTSPDHCTQSHENGAVVVKIRTNPDVLKMQEKIDSIEACLQRMSDERPRMSASAKSLNYGRKSSGHLYAFQDVQGALNSKDTYEKELKEYQCKRDELTTQLIKYKREIADLKDGKKPSSDIEPILKTSAVHQISDVAPSVNTLDVRYASSENTVDRWKEHRELQEERPKEKRETLVQQAFQTISKGIMQDKYFFEKVDGITRANLLASSILKYSSLDEFTDKCHLREFDTWKKVIKLYVDRKSESIYRQDLYKFNDSYLYKWYYDSLKQNYTTKQLMINKK